jgi:excinuclease ABC subunit A
MPSHTIRISGARTHNLKNVSVDLPQRQLTVVTGPSGSGKSSLAFNTLYAEGQRRFVESMSTYVRQFLERMERPDVDDIEGILPALAIEQKNSVKNARSTVATATELADYIRLFMTYCGETVCPDCGVPVRKETPDSIANHVISALADRRVVLLAPMFLTDETREIVQAQLAKGGYFRAWMDGAVVDLNEHDTRGLNALDIVIGRYRISETARTEVVEGIEQALALGRGAINILEQTDDGWASHRFTAGFTCNRCGREFAEPRPHLFSFNSPLGACSTCQGYGRVIGIDLEKVIPDRSRRLDEFPIAPWNSAGYEDCYDDLRKAAKKHKLRMTVPIAELSADEWDVLYNGRSNWYGIKGFFDWLETKKYKVHVRVRLAKYRSYETCPECRGSRLKRDALHVRFREKNVADIFSMNVGVARRFWEYLALSKSEEALAGHLRREVVNRLVYLDEVGLTYLTLDRQTRTLSGGESQRINLAAALGSGLTETLYVIDEPTVGLHARDSERLLAVLRRLRNAGNTVVVVEHDPTIIAGADHIVELGPGAGEYGGKLMYSGPRAGYARLDSLFARRVDEDDTVAAPFGDTITIVGAREHNLKDVTVTIPLNRLVAITGVSGSGKSTLIRNCLYNGYQRRFRSANVDVGAFTRIEGLQEIDDIQLVDQSPIGRSSRSNPATYVKAWDEVRKLLAGTTSAKLNGVTAGMFSFNTTGGRCDKCEGSGTVVIDMQFLADVEVLCDACDGRRFGEKVMKVAYKGRNVDAILRMTVDEAIKFFIDKRAIVRKLDALRSVGLGYLRLGQSTASLSGGEAQRLKLASFLVGGDRDFARRLFLFDEPTTGLHATDVRQLIRTFRDLIGRGNSVVVVEHNLQLIESADWVVDLGPDGGDGGGEVIATGPPRAIAGHATSITGRYLFKSSAESTAAAS